ncbi:probable D-arabinono-1,4-lactone oxidase at N-terminal half [Coccomyxa sp. Obi]|nr:probable D-arabinono-1,4-lactone oxidase at N-terminal half [Coccomyxa sp. Obi]
MVITRRKLPLFYAAVLLCLSITSKSQTLPSQIYSTPTSLEALLLPLKTALQGTSLKEADVKNSSPNWSALIFETLSVISKSGFLADADTAKKAEALQGLYTLWYAAGTSLGILKPLPGWQKDVLPHFAIDLPVTGTAAIKDGRLGYTNHTLTWQNTMQTLLPTAPGHILAPSSVEEVVTAVKTAAASGSELRCIGHGNSWTPIFFDTGATVLFTAELLLPSGNRIELIGSDANGSPLVRIAPGVQAGELSQWTDDNAVMLNYSALPAITATTMPRMAGAISTGSHGKGLGFGAIADFVHSIKLVNGAGEVVEYTATHPLFDQARFNFGLMGVIVEIVFAFSSRTQYPDLPLVYDNNTFPTLREVFGRPDAAAYIKELVTSHYSVEFLYFPLNQADYHHFNVSTWDPLDDKVWITAATRVALPTDGTKPKTFDNNALSKPNLALNIATYLGWLIAEIAQQTENLDLQAFSAYAQVLLLQNVIVKSGLKTLPSQIHYQPGLQQDHNYDFELCFKVSDDFSNVVAAWNAAVSIAKDVIAEYGSNALNIAVEWRFTGGSSVTLEGNLGNANDIYCWIDVVGNAWTPNWDIFVKRVFDAWTAISPDNPPKPHWAKWNALTEEQLLHFGNGASQDYWETYVKAVMEPQIAAFRPAVAAADPAGVFRNQFLDNLLGIKRT